MKGFLNYIRDIFIKGLHKFSMESMPLYRKVQYKFEGGGGGNQFKKKNKKKTDL